jgi:hypothetical protein
MYYNILPMFEEQVFVSYRKRASPLFVGHKMIFAMDLVT